MTEPVLRTRSSSGFIRKTPEIKLCKLNPHREVTTPLMRKNGLPYSFIRDILIDNFIESTVEFYVAVKGANQDTQTGGREQKR